LPVTDDAVAAVLKRAKLSNRVLTDAEIRGALP
jgi:hypothetical protein